MVIKHLTWGLASLLFVCYAEQQTFIRDAAVRF
jgi:hypothetical protein